MASMLTYTYSHLSADAAAKLEAERYDLVDSVQGKFYVLGLHDKFLIEGECNEVDFNRTRR